MTLCPIALAIGCEKCPAFKVCPLKGVIGDYKKKEEADTTEQEDATESGEEKDGAEGGQ
ncbi:MAG: hypothetical protein O3B01_28530 [Planctomycetota bacterium]|nr:hypothetical protein [Planctomycetota bacterium]MDA1142529.1 hypothetical protein [Planctomycetota bacterium]